MYAIPLLTRLHDEIRVAAPQSFISQMGLCIHYHSLPFPSFFTEMDSQQILPLRHVAEITTKNEGLHVLGIRFYYWLPVNFLKVYRRRRPSISGNLGRALITSSALCSLPVALLGPGPAS